jgi:hypothetical protein
MLVNFIIIHLFLKMQVNYHKYFGYLLEYLGVRMRSGNPDEFQKIMVCSQNEPLNNRNFRGCIQPSAAHQDGAWSC